jgi:alcohol dehydrogenase-like protein
MKAIRCREWGTPDVLQLEEAESPSLKPHQVRIRVRAAGVNFADSLMVGGTYQVKPPFPFTPGLEAAGEIVETGSTVDGLRAGQRVLAVLRNGGGYAEEIVLDAAAVVPIPDAMDFVTAAAFPVAYGTSHFALASRPEEFHLRALLEPCVTLSSHTAPDVQPLHLERLCLVHGLLPFPVGQWPRPNKRSPFAPAPLQGLRRYYGLLRPCAPLRYSRPRGWSRLRLVPSRRRRDEAQVLTFHTKAWSSFAPPTCRMPLGQYQGIPRADPGGRVTPRF